MKKIIICILGMLSLFLCSCKDKNKVNINETNSKNYLYVGYGKDIYDNGLIYGEKPAIYVDYETMESTVLCSRPNCTHTTSECVGNNVGDCPMLYNGYLYYFSWSDKVKELGNGKREYLINSKLNRASLDNSEIETVAEFTDCAPREYDGYLLIDDVIYFTGDNMNPSEDGHGNITTSNQGGIHYFCSIDLKTGKYTNYGSIYDGDKQYDEASHSSSAQIRGYYNSKIIINYEYYPIPVDPSKLHEMDEFEFRSNFVHITFEFNPVTKEMKESDLPTASYVDENIYVYADIKTNKSYVITPDKTYEFDCDTYYSASVINNKLFNQNEQEWYDLNDMLRHGMGEYGGYKVVSYYKDSYILFNGKKAVKLTEEELLALDEEK